MSNPYRDTQGIQYDEAPDFRESYHDYRAKLSRVDIPVIVKTGDQADALRELVHGLKMAEKHGSKEEFRL